MARGAETKEKVIQKIKEAFGEDYVATVDGKVYLWGRENGEKLQIAISLTCPKNMVEPETRMKIEKSKDSDLPPWEGPNRMGLDFGDGWDFSDEKAVPEKKTKSVEITQEEQDNLAKMLARLGL